MAPEKGLYTTTSHSKVFILCAVQVIIKEVSRKKYGAAGHSFSIILLIACRYASGNLWTTSGPRKLPRPVPVAGSFGKEAARGLRGVFFIFLFFFSLVL